MDVTRLRYGAVAILLATCATAYSQSLPWVVFEDPDSAAICDVVNAANVELVVLRGTDELAIVTGPDSVLEGTFVDADGFVFFDDVLTGALEFANDAEGFRGLWWLTLDGRIYALDLITGDPIETDTYPEDAFDELCDACPLWDVPEECDPAFLDEDFDGVFDIDDLCPGSPPDEAVDFDGCSCSQLDDDLDEINNCFDLCPDSPLNEAVDIDGCSCSQLDEDLDGIDDCFDLCPGTPLDEDFDIDGCSCSQMDGDLDGINDCFDICPNSLPGESVDIDGCPVVAVGPGFGNSTVILCGSMGLPGMAFTLGGFSLLSRRRRHG